MSRWHPIVVAVCLAIALSTLAGHRARAQTAAEACLAANPSLSLGAPLPRTAARLKAGDALRIIAVGSSSTTGLWMLNPDATYPEVMRRELAAFRPRARIEVINSGRVADTVSSSRARFQNDVLAYRPDLVIWQLGTNDAAWSWRVDGLKQQIVGGIHELKGDGADVVLMDLQYAPMVLASGQYETVQAVIAEAAREERVGLFSRFLLMRRSIEAGVPMGALVAWDGFHNSADGYECVGRALARAISSDAR
jgi:lysophospholipase L1-like esterase